MLPFTVQAHKMSRNRIGQVVFELQKLQKTRFLPENTYVFFVHHVHIVLS